jgi:hypothetical protein
MITKTGLWKRYLVGGAALMVVGFGLLATIDAQTSPWLLGLYMAVLGTGVGALMQNLVLAAQNDVPAGELGAATSVLSFFRSLGGTIGVSALGALLAGRVAGDLAVLGGGGGSGDGAVPDISTLPAPVRDVVTTAYGDATADLFLVATPIAALALLVVLFIREEPLKTTSGAQRLAEEQAAAVPVH